MEAWSALETGGASSGGGETLGGRLVSESAARLVSAMAADAVGGAESGASAVLSCLPARLTIGKELAGII